MLKKYFARVCSLSQSIRFLLCPFLFSWTFYWVFGLGLHRTKINLLKDEIFGAKGVKISFGLASGQRIDTSVWVVRTRTEKEGSHLTQVSCAFFLQRTQLFWLFHVVCIGCQVKVVSTRQQKQNPTSYDFCCGDIKISDALRNSENQNSAKQHKLLTLFNKINPLKLNNQQSLILPALNAQIFAAFLSKQYKSTIVITKKWLLREKYVNTTQESKVFHDTTSKLSIF